MVTNAQSKTLQSEALEYLMRATSGHATTADLRELEAWRRRSAAHTDAYRRAVDVWEALGVAAGESVTAADRAIISRRVSAHVSRRMVLAGAGTAVAAGIAGVAIVRPPLGLWPSLSDLTADYRTGKGEQRTIALANGISAEMNTDTSITRRPADEHEERIEMLDGEALIAAALDSSKVLTVVAADGRVVATRTRFNLRRDGDAVRVTCLEGSV
ncbi:MAG: FecR domain-containing protein, partial [Xanthobacteraceae bacterium]